MHPANTSPFIDRARTRVRAVLSHLSPAAPLPIAAAALVVGALLVSGVDAVAGTQRTASLERAATPAAEAVPRGGAGTASAASVPAPLRRPAAAADAPGRAKLPAKTVPTPGPLPVGKGMWIWQPERTSGGNAHAIVQRAKRFGLTHVYVRTGSSWKGFHGAAFLRQLLPAAHDAGLRVYGWDFPNLEDVGSDVRRSLQAIRFRTPGGHRIDGFVPDLETFSEGTASTAARVGSYARRLRNAVGRDYPLIACVPRPSPHLLKTGWPFAEAIGPMDAVAPMVYWLNRQPDSDVAGALKYLRRFHKPIIPVGQAYDGGPEGGRPGPPTTGEIRRFINAAANNGARGVSFWSWQHATRQIWQTIRDAPEYAGHRPEKPPVSKTSIRRIQRSLLRLGYPVVATGKWDRATVEATKAYQRRNGLKTTGRLDGRTASRLWRQGAPIPVRLLGRRT